MLLVKWKYFWKPLIICQGGIFSAGALAWNILLWNWEQEWEKPAAVPHQKMGIQKVNSDQSKKLYVDEICELCPDTLPANEQLL